MLLLARVLKCGVADLYPKRLENLAGWSGMDGGRRRGLIAPIDKSERDLHAIPIGTLAQSRAKLW